MTFVATLEPTTLWRHFDAILTIPRASKNEEHMRRFVAGVAQGVGLDYQIDSAGNLVVRKPATPGHGGAGDDSSGPSRHGEREERRR